MKNVAIMLLVLSFALFSLYLTGCDSEGNHEHHDGEMSGGKAQTICPVMGNRIDRNIYADHNGKRVYFCCSACIGKFKSDPEKYIKKLEKQGVKLEPVPGR